MSRSVATKIDQLLVFTVPVFVHSSYSARLWLIFVCFSFYRFLYACVRYILNKVTDKTHSYQVT